MIPGSLQPLVNHLWQSTLFAACAALLTLALRRNRAYTRYGLWLVASAKFLVPFSFLVGAASRFGRHPAAGSDLAGEVGVDVVEPVVDEPPLIVGEGL